MAGISPFETAARKERLLVELPKHGWSIIRAGIAAGWSPAYAKTTLQSVIQRDTSLCKRIIEKRQSIDARSGDKREKVARVLESIIDSETARNADKVRAAEVMGKMHGWLSEHYVMELPQRQAEIDSHRRELVSEFSDYWARKQQGILDAEIVEPVNLCRTRTPALIGPETPIPPAGGADLSATPSQTDSKPT